MAALFGATATTDAWLMANVVPSAVNSLSGTTLHNVLVPVLSELQQSSAQRAKYLGEMVISLTGMTVIIMALIEFSMPWIVHGLASSYVGERFNITVLLGRIVGLSLFPAVIANFLIGVLRANEYFSPTSIALVVLNMGRLLTTLLLGLHWGIVGVASGFVGSYLAEVLYLWCICVSRGITVSPSWPIRQLATRESLRMMGPILLAGLIGVVATTVDRVFATSLPAGNVSYLNYAFVVSQAPIALLLSVYLLPLFTRLSGSWAEDDPQMFSRLLQNGWQVTNGLILPVSIFLGLAAEPITRLVYQRGAFGPGATAETAHVLSYWALGLPGFALSGLLLRAMYATKETAVSVRISAIVMLSTVAGDLILIRPLGAAGLALATGVGEWLQLVFLLGIVRTRLQAYQPKLLAASYVIEILCAMAAFSTVLEYLLRTWALAVDTNPLSLLVLLSISFGISFAAFVGVSKAVRAASVSTV